MDVGCYCVSAARLLAGEPELVSGTQVLGGDGVDVTFTGWMRFAGDVMAHFDSGLILDDRFDLEVVGEEASLFLADPWHCVTPRIELRRAHAAEIIEVAAGQLLRAGGRQPGRGHPRRRRPAARPRRRRRAGARHRGALRLGRLGRAGAPACRADGAGAAPFRRPTSTARSRGAPPVAAADALGAGRLPCAGSSAVTRLKRIRTSVPPVARDTIAKSSLTSEISPSPSPARGDRPAA